MKRELSAFYLWYLVRLSDNLCIVLLLIESRLSLQLFIWNNALVLQAKLIRTTYDN